MESTTFKSSVMLKVQNGVLNASGNCGITQDDIKELDLTELNAENNSQIYDVSFMTKLKILNASGTSGIDQNGIRGLDLFELNIEGNGGITDISFMKNLKLLKNVFKITDKKVINELEF